MGAQCSYKLGWRSRDDSGIWTISEWRGMTYDIERACTESTDENRGRKNCDITAK
jgi:hypothetical protein